MIEPSIPARAGGSGPLRALRRLSVLGSPALGGAVASLATSIGLPVSVGAIQQRTLTPTAVPTTETYVVGEVVEAVLEVNGRRLNVVAGAGFAGDTLVVADRGAGLLRLFSKTGGYLGDVGGRGTEPGRFTALAAIEVRGDAVYVYDSALNRVSVFTISGALIGVADLRPAPALLAPFFIGPLEDGSVLVGGTLANEGGQGPGLSRSRGAVLRYERGGGSYQRVATYSQTEFYSEPWGRGGQINVRVPFGNQGGVAAADGEFFVVDGGSDRIGVYDAAGRLTRDLWLPRSPEAREVTSTDIEVIRAKSRATGATDEMLEVFDALTIPATVPVFGWYGTRELRLTWVDQAEALWVLMGGGMSDGGPTWTVFQPSGTVVFQVSASTELDILAATDGYVLVRQWDDADAESIEIRRLTRVKGSH